MKSVLLMCLLLVLAFPAQALRCNGRLVGDGDHIVQVRERCGDPFWIDHYNEWLIAGEDQALEQRVQRTVEVWYYNFGSNRFMQRLVFRDDRLLREDSLGYGFSVQPKSCDLDRLQNGISNGEIIARCGPPDSRRERYADQIQRDGLGGARLTVSRLEDWIYDPGSSKDYRLLRIVDGFLSDTERLDR